MMIQNSLIVVLTMLGIIMFTNEEALATSCQVYPSEYAYQYDSVNRFEGLSANCRRYSDNFQETGVTTSNYNHCDGDHDKLTLTDSDLGGEQYQPTDYYVWSAGDHEQLLFIFCTKVSLTIITLHYYSDGDRGLPRLRFYAVDLSDNFNVWDLPGAGTPYVDVDSVPPDGEPAGRRNVSINVSFNTTKVLMYKYSSSFVFAVSEVKFFTCAATTGILTSTMAYTSTTSAQTTSDGSTMFTERVTTEKESNSFINPVSTTTSIIVDKNTVPQNSTSGTIAIGVSIAILLLSTIVTIIVVVLIWSYKRRSTKQNLYTDSSYSMLSRGFGQQIQSQSVEQYSAEFYDQVHLSPSTGQTEFISKTESANINSPSTTIQNSQSTHITAGDNRAEHSSALNTTIQATTSQLRSQKTHEYTSEQPTYAAVDKSKKKKLTKQIKKEDPKCTSVEKGPPPSPYRHAVPSASMQEKKGTAEKQGSYCPSHTIEELYTAVKKKPKGKDEKDEEETPPIPPHTVEELYTAVQKKPKSNIDENKEAPSQIVLQNMAEGLYTEATKEPKDSSTESDDTEAAPPIPPHTVEELYTAVMKKPKGNAEDREEAPPISHYTVDEI